MSQQLYLLPFDESATGPIIRRLVKLDDCGFEKEKVIDRFTAVTGGDPLEMDAVVRLPFLTST